MILGSEMFHHLCFGVCFPLRLVSVEEVNLQAVRKFSIRFCHQNLKMKRFVLGEALAMTFLLCRLQRKLVPHSVEVVEQIFSKSEYDFLKEQILVN